MYISSKCTILIHALSKSAKQRWGLSHEALYSIYKGAILPLLLYGALICIEALEKECNKTVYNRVQCLINIKIAKAFGTTSNETPLHLDWFNTHSDKGGGSGQIIHHEEKSSPRDQPRSTAKRLTSPSRLRITEQDKHAIQMFTESSKSKHGVGAGLAIFIQGKLAHQSRYTLHNRCSNNQAEQLAIVKAFDKLGKLHINYNIPKTATVHTDSRITLQSLKNAKNHNYLIEEFRKIAVALKKHSWTIAFTWIKAHVGIYGNELADRLVKEATRKDDISFNRIPKNEIAQVRDKSIAKWQIQCYHTTKGLK